MTSVKYRLIVSLRQLAITVPTYHVLTLPPDYKMFFFRTHQCSNSERTFYKQYKNTYVALIYSQPVCGATNPKWTAVPKVSVLYLHWQSEIRRILFPTSVAH